MVDGIVVDDSWHVLPVYLSILLPPWSRAGWPFPASR
jgi:hypothetical protein